MPRTAPRTLPVSRRIGPKELKLLAEPIREFIVGAIVPKARTVADLARELRCPPTRLYHHVQRLVAAGLVKVERTELVSGIVERHFRATAQQLLLDRQAFGLVKGDAGLEAILSFVFDQSRLEINQAHAAGTIRLDCREGDPRQIVAYRSSAWLLPREAARLRRQLLELHNAVEKLARRTPPADSEPMSVAVSLFPTSTGSAKPPRPTTPRTTGRHAARRR